MQALNDIFSYFWNDSENDNLLIGKEPAPADKTNRDNPFNVPEKIVDAFASLLSARTLLRLALANKRLHFLLTSNFQSTFTALSMIEAARRDTSVAWPFVRAIESIQTVSISAQRPALFRQLALTISDPRQFAWSDDDQRNYMFDSNKFYKAIADETRLIPLPPRCTLDALALIDLTVATSTGSRVFKPTEITHFNFLKTSEKAWWPAMLESLIIDIPAQDLKAEIATFLEKYDDQMVQISDPLACVLATTLFFGNTRSGADVRSEMQRRFGVTRSEQWRTIDHAIASHIHLHFRAEPPGPAFDAECTRWRTNDEKFVVLAESAALAANPRYDFGNRPMISMPDKTWGWSIW
ncbi:hypothetical protein [Robbsia andropogonis]|uniref:hypothetical protein n=1 Tax=Robbsia andropogonis TaxID=28092 RepID=UPI0004670FC4|nr:hypothetical protein [Robbsia andropogonis]